MKKIIMLTILLVSIFTSGCIGSELQSKMSDVIKNDTRNDGIDVSVYTKGSTLIYDLKSVSGQNNVGDVFRVFLQFSEKVQSEKFDMVEMSYNGKTKFKLKGDYFNRLGKEYLQQNPSTVTKFSENLINIDGSEAYPERTDGFLGGLAQQIEDFNDFHKKWYVEDMIKDGKSSPELMPTFQPR